MNIGIIIAIVIIFLVVVGTAVYFMYYKTSDTSGTGTVPKLPSSGSGSNSSGSGSNSSGSGSQYVPPDIPTPIPGPVTSPSGSVISTGTSLPAGVTPQRADWRCGPSFGYAQCPSGTYCSGEGWCGNTEAHINSPNSKYSNPTINGPRDDWRCGPSFGDAQCPKGTYCSGEGWCGTTDAHKNSPYSKYSNP